MTTPLAAKIAREYGTPCAVIDMDRVERNIARIQAACDAAGVANRPQDPRIVRRGRGRTATGRFSRASWAEARPSNVRYRKSRLWRPPIPVYSF